MTINENLILKNEMKEQKNEMEKLCQQIAD